MTAIGVIPVSPDRIVETIESLGCIHVTLGETVGHKEVEDIRRVEAHIFLTLFGALFQLVGYGSLPAVEGKLNIHLAGLGLGSDVEIKDFVIGAVERHGIFQGDAGIIGGDICGGDTLASDHHLE